jgi:hypothetical protein
MAMAEDRNHTQPRETKREKPRLYVCCKEPTNEINEDEVLIVQAKKELDERKNQTMNSVQPRSQQSS